MGMSWQGILDAPVENLTEEQAKSMLHDIATTLANVNEDKAEHHDKIVDLFKNLSNHQY